jgi:hypothetical protein
MNDLWLFFGAWLIVAIVPFALYGAIRIGAWAAPALFRWSERIERQFYRTYWLVSGGAYLLMGILHFTLKRGEPIFGVAFVAIGLASAWRGMRGRPA